MNVQNLLRPAALSGPVDLRQARREEADAIGALLHQAFDGFQTGHGFASDFGSAEEAARIALSMIDDPLSHAVVAVNNHRIVGVNFLSEGDPIRGVGPIAVAPDADGTGIGRRLMYDVIERAGAAPSVRLLQDTFNMKSLALYATLGFRAREPYVVLKGRLMDAPRPDRLVRPMEQHDLPSVAALTLDTIGFPRGYDVRRALSEGSPYVLLNDGRLTGFVTDPGSWASGHAAAVSDEDFRALMLGVNALDPRPLHFLFPTCQAPLFRWLLSQGMRAEKQMLMMTRGAYRQPEGVYVPSVLY